MYQPAFMKAFGMMAVNVLANIIRDKNLLAARFDHLFRVCFLTQKVTRKFTFTSALSMINLTA